MERFYYSTKVLKTIAENYGKMYDGLEFREGHLVTNPWSLAEYRVDFDSALCSIGQGEWDGRLADFKYYRNFGKLQRVIIADILGVTDKELARLGFWSVPKLRGLGYFMMKRFLNGVDIDNESCYDDNRGE